MNVNEHTCFILLMLSTFSCALTINTLYINIILWTNGHHTLRLIFNNYQVIKGYQAICILFI